MSMPYHTCHEIPPGSGVWVCAVCGYTREWDYETGETRITHVGDPTVRHGQLDFNADDFVEQDIDLTDHEDERLDVFRAWMEGRDG